MIKFNSNRNKTQIRNYLINTIWPRLETKINTIMNNNFDAGWSVDTKLKVDKVSNKLWTIYPKFAVSGTTSLTGTQLRTGVSNLLADLKVTLKADFESQGATNVKFHIHYEDGRDKQGDET